MTKFNLHYGQARVRRTDEGEPIRMYHRPAPLRRAIQFAHPDLEWRENIQYDADLFTGTVEIEDAINIARMYILGWPLEINEVDRVASPLEARPGDEVALAALAAMPMRQARLFAMAEGIDVGLSDKDLLTLTARAIKNPWQTFGTNAQYQRRLNLAAVPTGLIFPSPDKAFQGTLEDDPFWNHIGVAHKDWLRATSAKANPDMSNWHWSDLYAIT